MASFCQWSKGFAWKNTTYFKYHLEATYHVRSKNHSSCILFVIVHLQKRFKIIAVHGKSKIRKDFQKILLTLKWLHNSSTGHIIHCTCTAVPLGHLYVTTFVLSLYKNKNIKGYILTTDQAQKYNGNTYLPTGILRIYSRFKIR